MRPGPDPRASRWIAVRIGVLAAVLAVGFGAVAARVFHLQVLRRDELVDDMVEQYRRQLVLKPRRGPITRPRGRPPRRERRRALGLRRSGDPRGRRTAPAPRSRRWRGRSALDAGAAAQEAREGLPLRVPRPPGLARGGRARSSGS